MTGTNKLFFHRDDFFPQKEDAVGVLINDQHQERHASIKQGLLPHHP